jgi:hypothetical protein
MTAEPPLQRSGQTRTRTHPHAVTRQPASEGHWADLCVDLIGEFPTVDRAVVVEEVARARIATGLFGLATDKQVQSSATIARNNLRLMTGEADLARLDPESHSRRRHPA